MATIHDVAKLAGVAPITVSRVINDSGYVSEATRQRVEAAAAQLDYVPNRLASGLRTKRTNSVALVLTDITNPYFTTVARGVEDTASGAGYTVTYCNSDEDDNKEKRYVDLLIQQQVDGILLVPANDRGEQIAYLRARDIPVVVLDRRLPEVEVDVVRCDSEGGAYELVRMLLDLGHEHIALLGGPSGVSTSDDRKAGYRRAMRETGLYNGALESSGPFTLAGGYQMVQQVLELDPRPTAIFAANNFIAIGALQALRDAGLHVPENMALVGFDDLPPALVMFPFLTVAAQPAYDMARKGTELLLARMNGQGAEFPQEIVLPTQIIVRQSSGEALVRLR